MLFRGIPNSIVLNWFRTDQCISHISKRYRSISISRLNVHKGILVMSFCYKSPKVKGMFDLHSKIGLDNFLVVVSWQSCSWRSIQGVVGLTEVIHFILTHDEVHTLGILQTSRIDRKYLYTQIYIHMILRSIQSLIKLSKPTNALTSERWCGSHYGISVAFSGIYSN